MMVTNVVLEHVLGRLEGERTEVAHRLLAVPPFVLKLVPDEGGVVIGDKVTELALELVVIVVGLLVLVVYLPSVLEVDGPVFGVKAAHLACVDSVDFSEMHLQVCLKGVLLVTNVALLLSR